MRQSGSGRASRRAARSSPASRSSVSTASHTGRGNSVSARCAHSAPPGCGDRGGGGNPYRIHAGSNTRCGWHSVFPAQPPRHHVTPRHRTCAPAAYSVPGVCKRTCTGAYRTCAHTGITAVALCPLDSFHCTGCGLGAPTHTNQTWAPGPVSDLDAFSRYPSHGGVAAPVDRRTAHARAAA